jgi:uncharacterized protein
MKKEFDPRRLDVKRFAEAAGQLQGEAALREWGRLLAEVEGRGAESQVHWTARGEVRHPGHLRPQNWLHLQAGACMQLVCQRCLQPVEVEVSVDRSFRFAPDEATAAAEDDDSEEDVLAESRAFDLLELVEDELLMAMPVVPRHEQCPVSLPAAAGEREFEAAQDARPNPFAVLGKLKGGR